MDLDKKKQKRREWYLKNRDKLLAKRKLYYQNNKIEVLKANKLYRENHKKEKALIDKKYYHENKHIIQKYRKQWCEENKESLNKSKLEYYYKIKERDKEKLFARRLVQKDKRKNPHLYPKVCVICGKTENIDFHHPLYSLPYLVYPLCRQHHKEVHT